MIDVETVQEKPPTRRERQAELTRQESDQLPDMTEYALARIESAVRRMQAGAAGTRR